MPDQRSVLKEFRSLEQKRASQGLSPAEEARLAELRDLVGLEAGAAGPRGGFDVNAAAARLRDSLLPAGLRNRPPPPEAAAEAPPVAEPELSPSEALAGAYEAQPFAPFGEGEPSDPLFDPATLGQVAPDDGVLAAEWSADAGAAPPAEYDAAGAGYDPAAGAYDPGAQGYGEAGAEPAVGWDPATATEGAGAEWQGAISTEGGAGGPAGSEIGAGEAPAWDPGQPYDPAAAPPWDPNLPYDPNAPEAAAAYDPNAPPYDPNAAPGWDPGAPVDPNAAPAWDASQPYDPNAPATFPAAAYDPNAPPAWDAGAAAAVDVAFEAFAPDAPEAPPQEASWDPSAEPPPEPAAASATPEGGAPEGWDVAPPGPAPAPPAAPLGEYDESGPGLPPGEDAGLESALPFDAAAEAAFGVPQATGAPALGEYDDTAGFSGSAFAEAPPAELAIEGGGFEAAQTVAPGASEGWHPETAVDEGFLLESGGSFDAAAEAVAPEWAVSDAPPWDAGAAPAAAPEEGTAPGLEPAPPLPDAPPADAYAEAATPDAEYAEAVFAEPGLVDGEPGAEGADQGSGTAVAELPPFEVDVAEPEASAPAQADAEMGSAAAGEVGPAHGDLGLEPEARGPDLSGPAPALDFSRPDLSEGRPDDDFAPPQAAAPVPEEDLPTIDGEEILEEIPAEDGAAAPALPLEFEPLVAAPSAGPAARAAAAPAPPAPRPAAGSGPPPPARAAPPPVAPRAPPPAPPVPPAPARSGHVLAGVQRVVVHTVEGQVKRGVLQDADLAAASLALAPQPGSAPEPVDTAKVKAIFFMLAPGEKPPSAEGRKVRVTFRDGRQIAGFSPDYDESGPGFFMVPGDARTNTGRIWVYRASVKQVAVS